MSIIVIIIEMLIFAALFTVVLFSFINKKEMTAGIHNYPPDIQEEYFKTHPRRDTSGKSKNVIIAKSAGVLMFTAILTVCTLIAGADTFLQGFELAFGMMVWIGCYDTFFLDWVLFANMKCFRLPGTEHMDEAYHQKWFHLKGMIFPGGMFGLIVAALVGLVVAIIR